MTVGAAIVAAGGGERMGGIDKIFAPLAGKPVLAYAIDAFLRAPPVERIAVVVAAASIGRARDVVRTLAPGVPVDVVAGGERRRDSVRAGIDALPGCEWLLIHDGARPLVTPALIEAALECARLCGAAVPGVPPSDTIKQVDAEGRVIATPDRASLRAIQTPQAFRRELLARAHEGADAGAGVTDDAMLVELLGAEVRVFAGDPRNIKITRPGDLAIAAALLREGAG